MQDTTLNNIRIKFEAEKKKREDYLRIKQMIKELEKNTLVQQYIRLNGLINMNSDFLYNLDSNSFDKVILDDLISKNKDDFTNNIFIFLGTYKETTYRGLEYNNKLYNTVRRNDPNGLFNTYVDIEHDLKDEIIVPLNKTDNFETTHTCIVNDFSNPTSARYIDEYKKIQAIYNNQQYAKRLILSKYEQ